MNFLILIYVILILNKESTLGDITFEEESRKLKLTLPELPDERIDLKNGYRLKETILDLLKRKLGFPVQKYSLQETDLVKQHFKTQSQNVQNQVEYLIPMVNLNLAEFGHLRYNKEKGFLDFNESVLDEDQIVAQAIQNILRLSKENYDETGRYWEDNYKENQAEDMKPDREIGQPDGIRRTCLGREEKCKEGTYRYSGECNLCACIESEWKCTDVKCSKKNSLQDTNHQMLAGVSKKMDEDIRNQATGCVPGDEIHVEGSEDCPCICELPSVVVCQICPAVNKIDPPKKRNTTKAPKQIDDYHLNYEYH